ncbi:helix-turn-helix transcriptional regulator [Paenibacillus sp. NEAU-GSW1]|uniref:helix-turn-helix transcriptional regulator n=1 Tax=Paenibacillus sp. NEAU-GSW1 TaxID=2682486 RepID=UPI0012E2B5F9|nr:helix-turn-helix transcriptional regulator [Paenibacillus sp. NEAU-GSW1]MUT64730.1 helix-turn-helix domain-containing protein [Paenibacillus sp. NEAU-GSW1]
MEQTKYDRHLELAQFLRSRRERLAPEHVGLPEGGRRRTPGLRREEVASLAGVSIDWYTRLEQGRDIQVSTQVLDSIARALRLSVNDRRHLFHLALKQEPLESQLPRPAVSPALQRFLDMQEAAPAFVVDPTITVIAWNKAASVIYGDYAAMSELERNSVWRTFMSPYMRELLGEGWEEHAKRQLARFRAGYGRFIGDPWWTERIEELTRTSPEFRQWWPDRDVLYSPEGKKLIYHPAAGNLAFENVSFQVSENPNLQIKVSTPLADYDTASKIRRMIAEHDSPQ